MSIMRARNPVFGRLDALVDYSSPVWKDTFKFVEPNLTGIGGLHLIPSVEEILSETIVPLLTAQDPGLRLERLSDARELLQQELAAQLEAVGRPNGTVCFVEPKYELEGIDEQRRLVEYLRVRHGMLPRSTLGLVRSAVPLRATRPDAPSPSAVRRMVPTLPGSCTASSTRATLPRGVAMSSRVQARGSTTARIPCGCSVSASASSSPGVTSTSGTPRPASAILRAEPRGVPSNAGETAAPRTGMPAARASSINRTPSASASPRRSRPRRRARSRMVVSSAPPLEVLTR